MPAFHQRIVEDFQDEDPHDKIRVLEAAKESNILQPVIWQKIISIPLDQ